MPQRSAQAQFAGYYVALEQGFYAEEGLAVEIRHPFPTQGAEEKIVEEQCDITTLPLSLAMVLVDGGIPLVNVLQTSMNNATVLISRSGEDPMTLGKGARVLSPRAGFGLLARGVAMQEGCDYEWIPAVSCVNIFISGAVDATIGNSYYEYYQLLQTGLIEPEGPGVYRLSEHGCNIQEEGVYVTRDFYEAYPAECEAFARASRRGWEWVEAHQEETLDLVMTYVSEQRVATNRVLQKYMLEEILRLQVDRDSGEREFRLRPDMVEQASDLLTGQGLLSRPVTLEELLP